MDKTLLKGLAVLEAVAEKTGKPRTIEELARQLQLTRSTVHRTLQTLAHAGYLAQEGSGSYYTTMKLFEIGASQLQRFDVRRFAQPVMQALQEDTGENVHLSVLEAFSVIYIDKIESEQAVRSFTAIGARAPAYAVATGKAMLAHQPEGYVERHAVDMKAHTPLTVHTLEGLREILRAVRRDGYATNQGEWREGVGGCAVPVFDSNGRVIASLGVSGPLTRLSRERLQELGPIVRRRGEELSAAIGYRPPAAG